MEMVTVLEDCIMRGVRDMGKLIMRPCPTCGAEMESCIALRCQRPIFLPDNLIMARPMVTTPMPPIWISRRITPCPNADQYVAVSFTTSPVTQVEETAVNIASGNGVAHRCCDDIGSISNDVPRRIRQKNLRIIA